MGSMEPPNPEFDLLHEIDLPTCTLKVYGDKSRRTAILDIGAAEPQAAVDASAILTALENTGLKLLADVGSRLREGIERGLPLQGLPIAEGTDPTKGESGRVDWKLEAPADAAAASGEDRVDFRNVQNIVEVLEGSLLFVLILPTTGADGVDVYGNVLPGLAGNPAPIRIGEHVRVDPTSGEAVAAVSGILRRDDSSVDVDPVFVVEGDLDFKVGNVKFVGAVHVKGNVQDGFSVEAKDGIVVFGSVFAATLSTEGDIEIHEGASGREKGLLEAGGTVRAKYLNGCRVTARGDVVIASEIINCNVRAGGRIVVARGNIIGGEAVALYGVEARQIGSPMRTPTRVVVGVDPETQKRIETLRTSQTDAAKRLDRIYLAIKPFIDDPASVARLPEARREAVKIQIVEFARLRREKQDVEKDLSAAAVEEIDPREQSISVLKTILPNVTMSIAQITETTSTEMLGPMKLTADLKARKIRNQRGGRS